MLVQSLLHSHLGQEQLLNPKDKDIYQFCIESLVKMISYTLNQRYFLKDEILCLIYFFIILISP